MKTHRRSYKDDNHNCDKIIQSDWLSAGPILTFIGQFPRVPGVIGQHAFARAVALEWVPPLIYNYTMRNLYILLPFD